MVKRIVFVNDHGEVQKKYSPMPAETRHFSEDLLQKLIFAEPNLLSAEEIDPDFSNLIPVSREVPVKSGSIDALYVTSEGKICIVETKLWRNPEAHRSVVAQIIDYAKDLSRLSFESFCESVTKNKSNDAKKVFFKKIKDHDPTINEIKLQQNIQDALFHGRFLLIIVGDEIFPEVALLTESISSAPHLEFNIALAELRFYRSEDDQDHHLLVVPQIVGENKPQVRAVVRVLYEEKKPEVIVTPIEPPEEIKLNEDSFMKTVDKNGQDVFKEILKLSEIHGFPIHWGTAGFSLNLDLDGKHVPLCYGYGNKAWFGQSLYTAFSDILRKVENGREIVLTAREKLGRTQIFTEVPQGKELTFKFKKTLSEDQITDLTKILVELAEAMETNSPKGTRLDS
jgi:hypothetical protein